MSTTGDVELATGGNGTGEPQVEGDAPTKAIDLSTKHEPPTSSQSTKHLDPGRESVQPLKCAVTITRHPFAVCICSWIIIFATLAASVSVFNFNLEGSRAYYIETNKYVKRLDGLTLAQEKRRAATSDLVAELPNSQLNGGFTWTIYFHDGSSDWILTRDNINIIKKFEDEIVGKSDYQKYCLTLLSPVNTTWKCLPRAGQIPYYQSVASEIAEQPGFKNGSWQTPEIKAYVRKITLDKMRGKLVLPSFNKDYNDTGKIQYYRSSIFMAGPIPNSTAVMNRKSIYKNNADRSNEQETEYNKFARPIFQKITAGNRGTTKEGGMRILAIAFSVFIDEILQLLTQSIGLMMGSMLFVMVYIWFHTQSFFLSCTGMTQIVMAFPLAYFVFYFIFQIGYVDFLTVLIIFVILGLGADDIFVLIDAFHQSEHIVEHPDDLEERMSYTYRRAAMAMLVTQMTTFFAFLATASSVVMPMAAFGLWAATLVACNYLLIITLYVSCLVIWQLYIRPIECRLGCCCGCCGPCAPKNQRKESENENPRERVGEDETKPPVTLQRTKSVLDVSQEYRPIERFFGVTWVGYIDRFKLIVLAFFTIVIGLGIFGTTQLKPQQGADSFTRDNHYFYLLLNTWPDQFYRGERDSILTLSWYWGVAGVDRGNSDRFDPLVYGTVKYDSSFDMTSPKAQQYLFTACEELRSSPLMFSGFVNRAQRVECFIQGFAGWLNKTNRTFPLVASNSAAQKDVVGKAMWDYFQQKNQTVQGESQLVHVHKNNQKYEVRFIVYKCYMNLQGRGGSTIAEQRQAVDDFEKLKTKINDNCNKAGATGVCNSNFIDNAGVFVWLPTAAAFVTSAFQGIAIALPLAFVILIFATQNIIIALFSVVDIAGVMMSELALIAAIGWEFGTAEAISVILIIGFSVDYVVHLGHAYVESPIPGRKERLRYAMLTMGVSVLSGGITTFGAGIFMTLAVFLLFFKMGIILITTIFFSLMWAFFFYPAMLAQFGPEGDFGRVPLEKIFFCCPQLFAHEHKVAPVSSTSKGTTDIR